MPTPARERTAAQLGVLRDTLSAFAVLGLALALVGIYGVIARPMAQRTSELAIRFALGARTGDVTGLVLASGLKLALLGATLGSSALLGVSRSLQAGFWGMRLDSRPILAATTLVGVAPLACWLPARRAARVHPTEALRADRPPAPLRPRDQLQGRQRLACPRAPSVRDQKPATSWVRPGEPALRRTCVT